MPSKRYKKLPENTNTLPSESFEKLVSLVKQNCTTKFDESIDLSFQINNKQKKSEINIRTAVNLPGGTGKTVKVAVVANEDKQNDAKSNGADLVGSDDLIETISKSKIEFDILIATPDMMPKLGKVAKILGPKGLMPNPKLGTVTNEISQSVKNAKSGQVKFKNDKSGIVHAGVGKLDFSEEDLLENIKTFYSSVSKSKPDTCLLYTSPSPRD